MNKKDLPVRWYQSILCKQILMFGVTLLPCVLFFVIIYRTFQTETITTVTETTLSRDNEIFGRLYDRISEIQFQIYGLFNESDMYAVSDLLEIYDAPRRGEKIKNIQDHIKWISAKDNYTSSIRIYLMRRNIVLKSYGYDVLEKERKEQLLSYAGLSCVTRVENGNVHIYSCSPGEAYENVRFISEVEIPSYRFSQVLSNIGEDEFSQGIILIHDDIYLDNCTDTQARDTALKMLNQQKNTGNLKGTFEVTASGRKYFCSYVDYEEYQISFLTIRSYDQVFNRMLTNFKLIPAIIAVNLLAIVTFLIYISRYIRKPVTILGAAFEELEQDQNVQIEDYPYHDEFSGLYSGFNDMSRRLRENIRQNYQQKIELQRAQLKQLQAQIDPHFLYNSLFLIKSRVARKDYEGVEELAGLLGDYYRFLNRNERDIVQLEYEVENACAYGRIQAARFSERMCFISERCPLEYRNAWVPRLILQPLVENALKYGLGEVEENGIIRLSFRRMGDEVCVIVESSGSAGEDAAEAMNRYIGSTLDGQEITSTRNITRRLHLFYGDEGRLQYENSEYGGLKAVVRLDGKRGEDYDTDTDCG